MITVDMLSFKELKSFHKHTQEAYECALNCSNKIEAEIVLRMLDKEFENKGYNVEKLFKGYKKHHLFNS